MLLSILYIHALQLSFCCTLLYCVLLYFASHNPKALSLTHYQDNPEPAYNVRRVFRNASPWPTAQCYLGSTPSLCVMRTGRRGNPSNDGPVETWLTRNTPLPRGVNELSCSRVARARLAKSSARARILPSSSRVRAQIQARFVKRVKLEQRNTRLVRLVSLNELWINIKSAKIKILLRCKIHNFQVLLSYKFYFPIKYIISNFLL